MLHYVRRRKNKICISNHLNNFFLLIDIQSRVAALMDQDQYVAMASLDLSAAFDVVNVDLLLVRLRKMGLPIDN